MNLIKVIKPQPKKRRSNIYPEDLLDNLIEGCQVISHDWRYLYVNRSVVRQGRKLRKQLIGNTMSSVYPGIEKTEMFTHLKHCMKKRSSHTMENEFTFPSGAKGWFELRMEPVPQGILIFSIDITERKKYEQHMKELDALKSTFITIVSHQLRTPLNVILWNLEELLSGNIGKVPKTQEETLRLTHKADKEIISRLNDLLIALDIEEGHIRVEKQPVELESVLRSSLEGLKEASTVKNITQTVEYPKNPLPVLNIDLSHLRSVFTKLIDNSITYTNEDGAIAIKLFKKDGVIRFEISDNGIGIPAGEQANIFARFVRGSNASIMKPDASGLGLYLAQNFIEAHKGKLGFTSEESKRSMFWFELPIKINSL